VPEDDAPKAIRDRNQKIRDEAAQKRKDRRHAERRAAVSRNLDAGEMVDDALARGTHAATGWLKRHFNVIQWVLVVGVIGGIGFQIYRSRVHKADAKATDALMAGMLADFGSVGSKEEESGADPSTGLEDPRPHFADEAARLKKAEDDFRAVGGNGAIKTLADLGLAGTLFDAGNSKDALATYQRVRDSALAKTDSDVRLRALEGAALSQEALGDKEAALKGFRELGSSDIAAFSALGLYHQARLAFSAGKRDEAKDLLKKVLDKVGKPELGAQPGFLATAARELLEAIDPSAAPPKNQLTPEQMQALMQQAAAAKQPGESGQLSKEKLQEILKQVQKSGAPAPASSP
jgi:Tetratricopeptide repeat